MQFNFNDSLIKLPESQEMFSDLLLNRKANDILSAISKEQKKMLDGDLMDLYGDFGVHQAKVLLDNCLSDLEYIKLYTASHNEQLIILADTLAITVGLMIKMFAAKIIIQSNTNSLTKDKEKVGVTLSFLDLGVQIMNTVLAFNLSEKARTKVNENFNALKNARNSLKSELNSKTISIEENNERIGIYIMIIIAILCAIFGAIIGGFGGFVFCAFLGIGVGYVIGGTLSGFINLK